MRSQSLVLIALENVDTETDQMKYTISKDFFDQHNGLIIKFYKNYIIKSVSFFWMQYSSKSIVYINLLISH